MIQSSPRRVFVTRHFERWRRSVGLSEAALCQAVREVREGLVDAVLGGGVVKKRLALPGRGKRGGTRVLIATDGRTRWFFVVGFRKNERDNVTVREFVALQAQASDLLELSGTALDILVSRGTLREICHGEKDSNAQPDPSIGARDRARSSFRRFH